MDAAAAMGGANPTRVLITGASGFAGSHLARWLQASTDWQITGLQSRPVAAIPEMQMLVCDLLDVDLTERVIDHHRPDIIFHLAAQAYVPKAVANPSETIVNNVVSQLNLFEACRKAQLDPIIVVVSSADIYGDVESSQRPIVEDQPFRPRNPYAVSKATQDLLALQYFLSYRMRIVRVRPFNHIGPGQSDRFVVSSLARQIAEIEAGKADRVLLVGNLDACRDFLDVRDVVRAYQLVAVEAYVGDVFNVASGHTRSIRSVLDQLLSLSSIDIIARQDPARLRPSDVPKLIGDATKLRLAVGWKPEIEIEESLSDTLNDWRRRVQRGTIHA
jgi:GDP-4-dehydro-6-deoxy-D-mannose reductase